MRRNYQDLKVWQRAMELVTRIYVTTNALPDTEKFGLVTQLQRAAVSIPSNIAEGAGRSSQRDFHYFLSVARGSLLEMETQLLIGQRLNMLDLSDQIIDDIEAVFAMLSKMMERLRKSN